MVGIDQRNERKGLLAFYVPANNKQPIPNLHTLLGASLPTIWCPPHYRGFAGFAAYRQRQSGEQLQLR
ncbi:MAG: hypothetical protein IPJ33_15860 [Gammaproteobacteria bacterium]|nr:hypothetical protein [Gammaproteobacteria bacterium]